MNSDLKRYQVAVQHPDISGFEVLDMLMLRDKLMQQAESLSVQEYALLEKADRNLLQNTFQFFAELTQITSLEYEREKRSTTPTHWWWYLDVLTQLPISSTQSADQEVAFA